MAKKPETLFKERIRPRLKALPNSWWEKIQQVTIRGTPDILGCVSGVFVALELKMDEKAPIEPLQIHKLKRIEKAGGIALVVYPENWDEVYMQLQLLAELGEIFE